MNDPMSSTYQHQVADFVQREVVTSVSRLIGNLCKILEHLDMADQEALYALQETEPDYEVAANDAGWEPQEEGFRHRAGETSDAGTWEELCDQKGIDADSYRSEIFEHWLVSDWLARRLREHGEVVVEEVMGLGPIWGRATTGQTISMDEVICAIYDETMAE